MSPNPDPIERRHRSSSSRASGIAQPPSTSTSPSLASTTYTLTALRASIGRGSGIRWMPSATGQAPDAAQCSPESGETAYAVEAVVLTDAT